MKLIEALKKKNLLNKRMQSNTEQIQKYASGVSTERPYFPTEQEQKDTIKELEQSTWDLWHEKVRLDVGILLSNILTRVHVNGKEYSLLELLSLKRQDGERLTAIYNSMNDQAGQQRLRAAGGNQAANLGGQPIHLLRYYDEAHKNARLRDLQDLIHEADARLEVVNATTDIVNVDKFLSWLSSEYTRIQNEENSGE